jgi:hypothetical protein
VQKDSTPRNAPREKETTPPAPSGGGPSPRRSAPTPRWTFAPASWSAPVLWRCRPRYSPANNPNLSPAPTSPKRQSSRPCVYQRFGLYDDYRTSGAVHPRERRQHHCVMHISISESWKVWLERMEKCGYPPNLGRGGFLVAVFVTSFFAAHAADTIFVIFTYGPHAFFVDGLRITNWKHGILSTGAELSGVSELIRGPLTLLFWTTFIGISEFSVRLVAALLAHRPRWMSGIARIFCGLLLFSFVVVFWLPHPIFHPVPLAAIIGGSVLILKGIVSVFRSDASKTGNPNP